MPGWKRFLLLCLLLCAPVPLVAQPGGYTGIDLVVLIDQSGSMWGYRPDHPELNDKYGHRAGIAQEIVVRLLGDVWRSPLVHRFSVIDFGDETEVVWSNQVLRYDPKDPGALDRHVRSQLSARIRPRTGDGWVNTNTPAAVEQGLQELAKMAAGDPRTGRRKIVLVITDGRANRPPADLRTMRDRVAYQAGRLKDAGAELWAVGLNDSDYYWLDGDGAFWESLTGPRRARIADRASTTLPSVVGKMVDEWLGRRPPDHEVKDHYLCPPYMSRLSFRVTSSIPHGSVRILDPAGVAIPRTAGGPGSDPGTFALFSVNDPKPGRYRIEKSADRSYVVTPEEVPAGIERLLPAGAADLGAETRIVFRATTAAGRPLAPLSKWPIRASVRITPPSGPAVDLPAESTGEGRFEAVWKPGSAGVYRAELRGLVRLEDGSERDVFQTGPHAYPRDLTVSNRRPFDLELESPRVESGLRLVPWADSASVELSLRDAEGRQVEDLSGPVREPETWLSLVAVDASGVPLAEPVPLVPDSAGTFTARVPVAPDWTDAEGLFRLGSLHLRVAARSDRMKGDAYLKSVRLPDGLEERRVGGDPLSVGPVDLLLPRWLVALVVVPLLVIAGWLGWLVAHRFLSDMVISRQDAARGRRVQLQIYDHLEGPEGSWAMTLPVGGARSFKLDEKVTLPVGDQRLVADRFRVTRLSSPRKPRARIEYRWQGKREKHNADLVAGSQKPLKGLPPEAGRMVVMLSESN